jgi:hypothetical protein
MVWWTLTVFPSLRTIKVLFTLAIELNEMHLAVASAVVSGRSFDGRIGENCRHSNGYTEFQGSQFGPAWRMTNGYSLSMSDTRHLDISFHDKAGVRSDPTHLNG